MLPLPYNKMSEKVVVYPGAVYVDKITQIFISYAPLFFFNCIFFYNK